MVMHEMIERIDVPHFPKFQELITNVGR